MVAEIYDRDREQVLLTRISDCIQFPNTEDTERVRQVFYSLFLSIADQIRRGRYDGDLLSLHRIDLRVKDSLYDIQFTVKLIGAELDAKRKEPPLPD